MFFLGIKMVTVYKTGFNSVKQARHTFIITIYSLLLYLLLLSAENVKGKFCPKSDLHQLILTEYTEHSNLNSIELNRIELNLFGH
jgi:hypothetical protein